MRFAAGIANDVREADASEYCVDLANKFWQSINCRRRPSQKVERESALTELQILAFGDPTDGIFIGKCAKCGKALGQT